MKIVKVTKPIRVVNDPKFGWILRREEDNLSTGSILGAFPSPDGKGWALKIAHRHSKGKPRLWIVRRKALSTDDALVLWNIHKLDGNIVKWLWSDPE